MQGKMRIAAALGALVLLGFAPSARGDGSSCSPGACVLLVEVDGLEPEDVTQAGTPFLWMLAHPHGGEDATGTVIQAVLAQRNGYMWQAARAPMSASTATSAASLLTAANPEQHGITADAMATVAGGKATVYNLATPDDKSAMTSLGDPGKADTAPSTLIDMVASADGNRTAAAFIGDPALANLFSEDLPQAASSWFPASRQDGDPRLCGVPRSAAVPVNSGSPAQDVANHPCDANDAQTLNHAYDGLNAPAKTPAFTYIHLAELGRTKQLTGDPELSDPTMAGGAPVKRALADLDASVATFVGRLATAQAGSHLGGVWNNAVLMVVGNHGYEPTPPQNRVPDPDFPTDPTKSFADFLAREGTQNGSGPTTVLVPQGTVGTVYAPSTAPADLPALATKIQQGGDAGCMALASATCIQQVLPVATTGLPNLPTLMAKHPSWYLDPLVKGKRTGAGGDLLVILKPGWAFGRAVATGPVPVPDQVKSNVPQGSDLDNPYLASAGGPRDREIAMLMDGPNRLVRQVKNSAMQAKDYSENPVAADGCHADGQNFAKANAPDTMGDDAAAAGHECQAETVDIPLSIATLLQVPVKASQISAQGRLLKEAIPSLKMPEPDADIGPQPEPDPEPPPAPPPVIIERNSLQIIPARKPKDPFPFKGLIRRLRARVVDSKGRPLAQSRRGAKMTSIEVSADFGKPQSIVRLTFYKRGRKRTGGLAKRLVAIAKFKPFSIKRGPAKLRLRVPDQFAPEYIGVSIQQVVTVAKTGAAADGRSRTIEKPIGPKAGGIAAISDAGWLHRRKKGRT